MQKYSLLKDIYGHLCLDSNGEGYLVSDVEANINDLITAKNGRIAGLEAALAEKEQTIQELCQLLARGVKVVEYLDEQIAVLKTTIDVYKQDHVNLLDEIARRGEQIATLRAEGAKYKAFWDNSRMVDQMKFEEYDWPRILKEGKSHE